MRQKNIDYARRWLNRAIKDFNLFKKLVPFDKSTNNPVRCSDLLYFLIAWYRYRGAGQSTDITCIGRDISIKKSTHFISYCYPDRTSNSGV